MLRTRVITGSILAALLLLGLFLLPRIWVVVAFGVVFAVAAWEWAGFGTLRGLAARLAYTAAMAAVLYGTWWWSRQPVHLRWVLTAACLWWVLAFFWLSMAPSQHRAAITLLCGVPALAPAFVALGRLLLTAHGFAQGPVLVLWLIMLVCAADIGAYFAGRRFGRRKLAPQVSPGKTWEGALGGLLASSGVAGVGAVHFGLPLAAVVGCGCAIGIFSIIGDLTESMFKRAAALKDSGKLLPGHGGMLDRLDSVTAAAPLYALGLFGSGVLQSASPA